MNGTRIPERDHIPGLNRRTFLGLGSAGGVGAIAADWPTSTQAAFPAAIKDDNPAWLEATIPELQRRMASGTLTSVELTVCYLRRIERLNPRLGAVIETNPLAVATAAALDIERRFGRLRGPLHGIPILVKDNVATDDLMQTTAGSLSLVDSRVPRDARIVANLRAAGAIILGKANLSEWANFRGYAPFNGWSARGGFTRDPYALDYDPCGSSSGSAAAAAAGLCAAAIGTETDGSIVCPAGNNLVVGLKPTLGLLAQDGIIPIAHSQDTAGPIVRTVTDAAVLLGVLRSPFGEVAGHTLPADYTQFLRRGALSGARIGLDQRYFSADFSFGGDPEIIPVVLAAVDTMKRLGAIVVTTDTGDIFQYYEAELTVLLYEFKVQIAEYLATLRHTRLRTLADLIEFNLERCSKEMKYFGQELFELADATSGNLNAPEYLDARRLCLRLSREEGIDAALTRDRLDAIVAPSYSYATQPAAVAGYPNISVPVGLRPDGNPVGIWMYAGFLQEGRLLGYAYDLEQELKPRSAPQFLGSTPPEPADAGICSASPTRHSQPGETRPSYHFGTGKPFRRICCSSRPPG